MTPTTQEWVDKAESDYNGAGLLFRARKRPSYDGACFHAQQCAEKYLKARLQEAAIPFPRTHDLVQLLDLVVGVEPALDPLRPRLDLLSKAVVEVRYPGRTANKTDAKEALATARDARAIVRAGLALPP